VYIAKEEKEEKEEEEEEKKKKKKKKKRKKESRWDCSYSFFILCSSFCSPAS